MESHIESDMESHVDSLLSKSVPLQFHFSSSFTDGFQSIFILFLFFSSGVELKILEFKKDQTSLIMTTEGSAIEQPGIFKVSKQGQPVGCNLRGATFCRLCGSAVQSYSDAFHHSAEFGCLTLLQENAISCPVCAVKISKYQEFVQHMRAHKELTKNYTYLHKPHTIKSKDQVKDFRKTSKLKAIAVMWQLEVCKKLYEGRCEDDKLFLPYMSSGSLSSLSAYANFELCSYMVCVKIGAQSKQHVHDFETAEDGSCYACRCFHHYVLTTKNRRICTQERYKGILPV